MKKLFVVSILISSFIFSKRAQSQKLEDAINYIYYERYTSAKQILQQIVASNSNDANAQYWLGQVFLSEDNIPAARDIYQKALTATANSPLILVGMGHVELLEGKANDARQRFETALNLTKGKKQNKYGSPDVLKAIGRANADGDSKIGDPTYGIEKLTQAAEVIPTDPDVYVNMGILYLKRGDGGQAVSNFRQAQSANAKYAKAIYREARVYITQLNTAIFLPLLEKSISIDPAYAPAYFDLYDYYKREDVNKAKTYLEQYIAHSDKDCKTSFFYADYLFRAAKYQESLDKAKELQSSDCGKNSRIHVLFAYNYNQLGDSVSAKTQMEQFINVEDSNKVMSSDYAFLGSILNRFAGNENNAANFFVKASNKEMALGMKLAYLDSAIKISKKSKNYVDALKYAKISYSINLKPTNRDIYNLGEAAYFAADYTLADSMFTIYKTKYPDQKFGYYWRVKVAQASDTAMDKGLIVKPVEEYIQFLEKDKATNGSALVQQYGLLAAYYANVVKDKVKAIYNLQKILEYDPQNADAKKYIDLLNKSGKPSATPKPRNS